MYFEKENIYTLDSKGEIMLTIMSSLAQEEESRSISENVTWGSAGAWRRESFFAPQTFPRLWKDSDGQLYIVEKEAETVRSIYKMFLDGKTVRTIADFLTGQGIPTPAEKELECIHHYEYTPE